MSFIERIALNLDSVSAGVNSLAMETDPAKRKELREDCDHWLFAIAVDVIRLANSKPNEKGK